MKEFVLAVLAILGVTAVHAGDLQPGSVGTVPQSTWNFAFGTAFMSDYNVRGITQSAHKLSVAAYFEPQYNVQSTLQLYAGLYGAGIDFPNRAAAQIVPYGGIRPTLGKLALDFGLWYVAYPGGLTFNGLAGAASCTTSNAALCNTSKGDVSFWEVYARPTYALNDAITVGGSIYYSPSLLNTGAFGTYASVAAKVALPNLAILPSVSTSVSGEVGHYWQGTTDAFYGVPALPNGIRLPDYNTWNVGVSFVQKTLTLDLRYYDTDLTKANCNVLTGDHTATFGGSGAITPINPSGLISNWCSAAFIAKISFDATQASLK